MKWRSYVLDKYDRYLYSYSDCIYVWGYFWETFSMIILRYLLSNKSLRDEIVAIMLVADLLFEAVGILTVGYLVVNWIGK